MNPTPKIMKRLLLAILPALILVLPTANAQGLQYTLQIVGPEIKGSTVLEGFEDQIAIQSFSFNAGTDVQIGTGTNPVEVSLAQFSGVSCLLALDPKATPKLLLNVIKGQVFQQITLFGVRNIAGTNVDMITLTMEDVYISEFSQQGTDGDQPLVQVTFIPVKITYTTKELDNQGGVSDAPVTMTWNFKTATAE